MKSRLRIAAMLKENAYCAVPSEAAECRRRLIREVHRSRKAMYTIMKSKAFRDRFPEFENLLQNDERPLFKMESLMKALDYDAEHINSFLIIRL